MFEHKIILVDRHATGRADRLNPYNGNLASTLDAEAAEGWSLLSYDWSSWRRAVLVREVPEQQPNYVAHYTSQDLDAETWSVYREEYDRTDLDNPIDGTTLRLGSFPNEAHANSVAGLLQEGANR